VDEHCYVYGFLPASAGCEGATPIGFCAHMDTSDEASGENVRAMIHENYDGSDVVLGESGRVLSVERFPFLPELAGETLITTDGTTLLGADDKAGIAEIMTALQEIAERKLPHGPIWICFTPDEEIGEGTDYIDLEHFAPTFAYTVDGGDVNAIEYECFNAASANIVIHGLSVHPGDAKDKMINAQNVAWELHSMLPRLMRPEHTEGYEGFYHLTEMRGRTEEAILSYIIRDHDRARFEEKKQYMQAVCDRINVLYGAGTAELTMKDSYYNMREKIEPHMELIEIARVAIQSQGLQPIDVPIRGGTDGARLSYEGIPCPNLGTGGFNFHGVFECITVERMEKATGVLLEIVRAFSERR